MSVFSSSYLAPSLCFLTQFKSAHCQGLHNWRVNNSSCCSKCNFKKNILPLWTSIMTLMTNIDQTVQLCKHNKKESSISSIWDDNIGKTYVVVFVNCWSLCSITFLKVFQWRCHHLKSTRHVTTEASKTNKNVKAIL